MARTTKDSKNSIESKLKTTPIAIIGMGSIFPQAHNTQEYWDNILRKIDCVTDVPPSRWKIEDYYDPNPTAADKTYCKRGGFIPDIEFDPMEFGLPPNILEVTDVSQLLSLIVARDALEDAGYGEERAFDRENVGVVLGVVGMSSKIFTPLINRLQYPVWEKVLRKAGVSEDDTARLVEKMKLAYIGWEENAFPGAIGNVISGRICNRFDLGGVNCVVDAACASSMAAIKMAVSELIEGRADMMITGGVDTDNTINTYMCFSKTPAFSKSDRVRTFDANSDGMMVGEGIGMVVMKRLEDAERDGDRVYAVIKGIGTSSDGRFKSIYAPRPAGQAKALRRAYAEAGFDASTVGLIEAHGTGTMAGDPAEFAGLSEVFGDNNPRRQYIALGSVKSQIAHTKAAAGVASLMKTALALHNKVLPASINVSKPNPKFDIENTPFYVNTEVRPWIRAGNAPPRRAGVSSFGFGGTNFHVVLEEFQAEHSGAYRTQRVPQPVLLAASDPAELLALCQREMQSLSAADGERHLAELTAVSRLVAPENGFARIGFVADGVAEARLLLQTGIDSLVENPQADSWEHPKGVYYRKTGLDTHGKVVALFSGQGSQYLEMGRELAVNFPTFRQVYGAFDDLFAQDSLEPLSSYVYPRPVFDSVAREKLADALTRTDHAQPAIGAFSAALYKLLQQAGFASDFVAGHSFGELTALWAGGVLGDEDFYSLAKARGKAMVPPADPGFDAGSMMAVKGDGEKVRAALLGESEVVLANWNSNNQVVIAGSKAALARAQAALTQQGFSTIPLPVSAAFHTPLVGHAQKPFAAAIKKAAFKRPAVKVYANGTGRQYSQDPEDIRQALAGHILNPVLFRDEIQNIYADGGRVFVEFGPKNVLTNLVGNILEGQPHVAVALNANAKKDADRQLREAVLQLRVAGLPLVNFDPFEQVRPLKAARKKSPVTVNLNAGYYLTEKTRMAYENALNDGFQVGAVGSNGVNKADQPVLAGLAHSGGNGIATSPAAAIAPTVNVAAAPAATTAPAVTTAPDTGFDLLSAEHLLAEYQSHQSETLRLHEQYLRTEEEYARAFAQLTQLQTELVSKGSAEAGQLAAVLPLFESLERSMTRFHDHQSETLRIHQRYLETQERFSGTFVQGLSSAGSPVSTAPAVRTEQPIQAVRVNLQPAAPAPAPTNGAVKTVYAADAPGSVPAPAPAALATSMKPAPAAHVPATVVGTAPARNEPAVSADSLTSALLAIVSEKTGYPQETLELDMDMEADLGIDSIKRVEILGAMQNQFSELPKLDPAELGELRTLGQITDRLGAGHQAQPQPAAAPAVPEELPALVVAAAAEVQVEPTVTISVEQVSASLLQVVSEKTGYPVDTLELEMDMEADLGIDSIKRVEILGAMQTTYPDLPKLDPVELGELRTLRQIIDKLSAQSTGAPALAPELPVVEASASASVPVAVAAVEAVSQALLQVVSEKTGYPVETLELEMDMEADLGIDSIKRVEILGAMQTQFPDLPKPQPDMLAELCTLQQIITFLSSSGLQQEASNGEVRPFELPAAFEIEQGLVTRKLLPPPDSIDLLLPAGHSCLLTDDGSAVTAGLAQVLAARGWPVAVLRFPTIMMPSRQLLPEQVTVFELDDLSEAHLEARLAEVALRCGPVAVFIHMAPAVAAGIVPLSFPEGEQALVKLVFLAAKHLKTSLNPAGHVGRAVFMTVTHLDGEFGLGQNSDYAPVNGGLFGLVKTLNLEWESVFCRAVDLHPTLEAQHQIGCILAELHDPNRLVVEVGYTLTERSTLTLSPVPVTGAKK